jgi:tRNA(Met) C34 N-acetyltransferase TmcA
MIFFTTAYFSDSISECNLQCSFFFFQYIHPTDAHKLGQAELLVIDEAAAIPLPYVKSMLGPYLVFLASTINGLVNSL